MRSRRPTARRSASPAIASATRARSCSRPGYGNAARAFTVDTVPKNWVQYLGEHGWDVWLLDYRASPDLPSSYTQFTVDDIALRDWPAAVEVVRRETRTDSVQAMGHCIGGLTLFMALGGGLEGVRAATISAVAGHPVPTPGNRLRAWVRVPTIMKALGIKNFTSDYDPRSWNGRIVEALMRIAPFRHIYNSPVARRIYFMYGDVYRFENINRETMERAVPSFFGNTNMTFFEHMGVMVRAGRALDAPRPRRVPGEPRRVQAPDRVRDRRAQPDVHAGEPAAHARGAAQGARAVAVLAPRVPRLRAPRPVARHERRARRLADRAGRAWSATVELRWAARPLQLPADVGAAGPPHAPRGPGRVAAARRAAVRERQRALAA